jgi:hypothetical protein
MLTRIALTALALVFTLGATACGEKKKDPVPEAKAECKLIGDWEAKTDAMSASMTFDSSKDAFGMGTMMMGDQEVPDASFNGTKADIATIEGGKASTVQFKYRVGDQSAQTEDCKMQFVDDCKALQAKCEGKTMKMTRAK